MKLKEKIKEKLNRNKLTKRFLSYDFRTVFFTVISLIFTTGYAAFYAVMGILYFSSWYGVLASYYMILVVMRSIVVFYHNGKRRRRDNADERKEKISRAKIYGGCGIVIGLLTLPLSVAIMMMVAEKATFSHAGLMIYVAAVYTFYKVFMTVWHFVKVRRSTDLTVRTVRCINLADTLVSVLALQTAMFDSFSPDFNESIFNAVTGAVVCLFTVIIGVFMIAGCKREITKINYEENLKNQKRG